MNSWRHGAWPFKEAVAAAVLFVMLVAPAFAQFATKGEIDILNRQIMDLDFRLRALEREKVARQQAERDAENARQREASWEIWRECRAYRQRVAEAKTAGRSPPDDSFGDSDCRFADKFEVDNAAAAKARLLDQKKR